MGPRLRTLLVLLFSLCCVTYAQQSSPISKAPKCAQICLLEAFAKKTCAPTDQTCICTNAEFQTGVTACVTLNCTIPEALVMKNISSTNCGLPVRDRRGEYTALSYAMIIVGAVFVFLRMAFKLVDGHELGLDDYSMLATMAVSIASTALIVHGSIGNGLGKDLWTLEPDEITRMLKSFYIQASLYFSELTLLKLSLIFFYIRVFPTKGAQRLLWGTVIFTCCWGAAFVIVAIFQCRPINYFWNKWDGLHKGKCLDINAITICNASISIALDIWSLGIPLWQLWGLKMHWKKKVGVAMMFCVGTFITVVSILRLQALVNFAAGHNVSWDFYDVSIWSSIEIGVGIMCTCLPTLRLLLVKLFPILGGSSARSGMQYQHYGSGNELGNMSKGGRSRGTQAGRDTTASRGSGVFSKDNGITVETSYTVKRSQSDTDEASLVSHETREKSGARSPRSNHF